MKLTSQSKVTATLYVISRLTINLCEGKKSTNFEVINKIRRTSSIAHNKVFIQTKNSTIDRTNLHLFTSSLWLKFDYSSCCINNVDVEQLEIFHCIQFSLGSKIEIYFLYKALWYPWAWRGTFKFWKIFSGQIPLP